MSILVDAASGSCPCGAATFSLHARPLARFYCHCLICQKLYEAPFADVTVFRAGPESLHDRDKVAFNRYRPPPALRRGTCTVCHAPVFGYLHPAPLPRLLFVPTRNLEPATGIPEPSAHIFYHRRLADAADAYPKFSGYWKSELAVTRLVFGGMLRG